MVQLINYVLMGRAIEFAQWTSKNRYVYYFNGEIWQWVNPNTQEYYSSEELYEKYIDEISNN